MREKQKIVLFDIDYTLFDTGSYKDSSLTIFQLYQEVVSVLKEVGKFATIGIFSEGELDHQLKKLIQTDIKHYFHDEHLHIFTQKLTSLNDVLAKYKEQQLFFVDDKLEVLQHVKQANAEIVTIWIKRGIYAEAVAEIPGFHPDEEVIDLKLVAEIIHNKY